MHKLDLEQDLLKFSEILEDIKLASTKPNNAELLEAIYILYSEKFDKVWDTFEKALKAGDLNG